MLKHLMSTWRIKKCIFGKKGGRAALLILTLFFTVAPSRVLAADFAFRSFGAEIVVNTDGSFDVQETLVVDFFVERHGIFRVIPQYYAFDESRYQYAEISEVAVTDAEGNALPAELFTDGALTIKIGDPDVTVQGEQTYVIDYRVDGALLAFAEADELYWNVTGTEWESPPEEVSTRVTLPLSGMTGDTPQAITSASCYTGMFGSTAQDCTMTIVDNTVTFEAENDFLTVAVSWPKGIVTTPEPTYVFAEDLPFAETISNDGPPPLEDTYYDWFALLIPALVFYAMHQYWMQNGRDPKGRGAIVVQYEPPVDVRPSELGVILDGNVSPRDLSAAIVDLAVRGHVRIVEKVEERWGPDRKTFTLERLDGTDTLRPWEQKFLQALFSGATTVTEDTIKKNLPKQKKELDNALYDTVVEQGYFAAHPQKTKGMWVLIGLIVLFLGYFIWGAVESMFGRPVVTIAILATGAILVFFGLIMAKRTEKGVAAYEHARGFKDFLATAEKYRLQWQEKEGIFEAFLPYAMVFGVADKWAKAFADLHIEQKNPSWYVGATPIAVFNPSQFASQMTAMSNKFATAVAPKSSGSSGGGSSGGGFGGGGGGGW